MSSSPERNGGKKTQRRKVRGVSFAERWSDRISWALGDTERGSIITTVFVVCFASSP